MVSEIGRVVVVVVDSGATVEVVEAVFDDPAVVVVSETDDDVVVGADVEQQDAEVALVLGHHAGTPIRLRTAHQQFGLNVMIARIVEDWPP